MSLAWELPPPWDWLVIGAVLAGVSGPVFWLSWSGYQRRYFPGKALQMALGRTFAWLVMYGGSFALIFGLISLFLPAGGARYLVGAAVWWLVSETALALAWPYVERLLEVL